IMERRKRALCFAHAANERLWSFPARRSSDLARAARGRLHRLTAARRRLSARRFRRARIGGPDGGAARGAGLGDGERPVLHPLHRSEEHTAELQSLRQLVCRLRLEKKKYVYPG